MNHIPAAELEARLTWRPTADPDACDHDGRAFYLEAGPGHVVRRCRSCGMQLAPVDPRCIRILAIGRRCMAPGRDAGLCRAHAAHWDPFR